MPWITPVFDRDEADIELARLYQAGELTHGPLTMADSEFEGRQDPFWVRLRAQALKGFLNASDLSRIECNAEHLADCLLLHGYAARIESKTDWSMTDFQWAEEMERIRLNVAFLRALYTAYPDTPEIPETLQHPDYVKINEVERILYDIKRLITYMEQSLPYCGETESGEV